MSASCALHPDFAPATADLDDPSGYVRRRQSPDDAASQPDEVDTALEALLAQGTAELDAERGDQNGDHNDNQDDGSGEADK